MKWVWFAAAAAVMLNGCGGSSGGGGGSAAAPAIPTQTLVTLTANQRAALEPVTAGAAWTYACQSGLTPQITASAFGAIGGAQTYEVTSPLPVGRASSSADSIVVADDGSGNVQYYGFVNNGTFTAVAAPVKAEDVAPQTGASYTLPELGGGTVTSVFQGFQSITVPAGSYANVAVFHNTYSKNSNVTADFYDVAGVGTIRINYTTATASDRCDLTNTNI